MSWIGLAERGLVPDALVRREVRRLISKHLRELAAQSLDERLAWVDALRSGPILPTPDGAHARKDDVAPRFFETVLGPRMLHGAGLWPRTDTTLAESEQAMLACVCERAGLQDGMRVLDVGAGLGALSLWIAEHYPSSRVLALASTKSAAEWIASTCQRRGLGNVEVRTDGLDHFEPGDRFDRVLSLEQLERVHNWELLFQRVAGWLAPNGRLFAQFFCHREVSYPCAWRGAGHWRPHLLSGGMMPSEELPYAYPQHLRVARHWRIGGTHYQRTLESWLARLDADPERIEAALAESARDLSPATLRRHWRLFFISCAEIFGYAQGESWHVAQFRMEAARTHAAA